MASQSYRVIIIPRTLVFKQAAGTSRGFYKTRKVWYILVASTILPSVHGIGECAPLPDLSCDAMPDEDYTSLLRKFCDDFERTGKIDYEGMRPYPSMLFGLETALFSVQASASGRNPHHLFENAFYEGRRPILTNGLVWMGNYDEMSKRIDEKLDNGFRCIKLKIGSIDFDSELSLLKKIRNRYGPSILEIRVDANGAFGYDEALVKLNRLSSFHLHSIEQPIPTGQWEKMGDLCKKSPVPIALDEELIGINNISIKSSLLDTIHPHYLVLKPSLHGGMSGCNEWIELAACRNIPFWITSALESNIGLNAIAGWCYEQISNPAFTHLLSNVAFQGLGTGLLYVENYERTQLSLEGDCLYGKPLRQRNFECEVSKLLEEWLGPSHTMVLHTSGSTGTPQPLTVDKKSMQRSALRTCRYLGLHPGDTALLCLPLQYVSGQMMLVRSEVGSLRLISVTPDSRPFRYLNTSPDFAALTPLQVAETLRHSRDCRLMRGVKQLIIGGGAIPPEMECQLRTFPNAVWSTYGMTETLSHVALRRISGASSDNTYHVLPEVSVSLDESGCLVVNDPITNDSPLLTHDIAELVTTDSFIIKGRIDNVICSGGIKLHLEEIEEKLTSLPFTFRLTYVNDYRYGQALVMLHDRHTSSEMARNYCRSLLDGMMMPKYFAQTEHFPMTETFKPARRLLHELAEKLVRMKNET